MSSVCHTRLLPEPSEGKIRYNGMNGACSMHVCHSTCSLNCGEPLYQNVGSHLRVSLMRKNDAMQMKTKLHRNCMCSAHDCFSLVQPEPWGAPPLKIVSEPEVGGTPPKHGFWHLLTPGNLPGSNAMEGATNRSGVSWFAILLS